MPNKSLPDRVEEIEQKLAAMEAREQLSTLKLRARGEEPSSKSPASVLSAREQRKKDKQGLFDDDELDRRRGLAARRNALQDRSLLGQARRALGPFSPERAAGAALAATTAAPLALEALGQIGGLPGLQEAAGVLGNVLPVQRLSDEAAGARAALSSALAFGRAGVGLTAEQLQASQGQARQLAQREREADRRRNVAAVRRQLGALQQTLGSAVGPASDPQGRSRPTVAADVSVDTNLGNAGARVAGELGLNEEAGRFYGEVAGDLLGQNQVRQGDLSGQSRRADRQKLVDEIERRRRMGMGVQ